MSRVARSTLFAFSLVGRPTHPASDPPGTNKQTDKQTEKSQTRNPTPNAPRSKIRLSAPPRSDIDIDYVLNVHCLFMFGRMRMSCFYASCFYVRGGFMGPYSVEPGSFPSFIWGEVFRSNTSRRAYITQLITAES